MRDAELRTDRRGVCVRILAMVSLVCGLSIRSPATASSAYDTLRNCREHVSKQGNVYAKQRRLILLKCIDKLLKCELPREVEGVSPAGCPGSATDYCKGALDLSDPLSKMSKARQKFIDKAGAQCLFAPFSDVMNNTSGGLWYSNDPACGASVDLPTLLTCLRDEIDEKVDEMVARTKPRACLVLTNAGRIGDYSNLQATCPPTTPETISATSSGSGTLVDPGTIAVGAGNTITFIGDGATLPCGGGSNGKLTVQIGNGGTSCTDPAFTVLQEQVVREPYGSGSPALMGPFASDVNYCIALKDASCSDKIFGLIDYP